MSERDYPSFRHAYLAEIFNRLESGDDGIKLQARALMQLWRQQTGMNPWYWETWERLLEGPVDAMRTIVMAENENGEMLRHSFPFTGILSNRERSELRRKYPGVTH